MEKLIRTMKMLAKDEEGASAVEYGVLVAGIILVSIVLIYSIGGRVGDAFNGVDAAMSTNAPGTPRAAN